MNILQRKCVCITFLRIKAYRNPLYRSNVVNSTSLIKICQSDMTMLLINPNRSDWRRNFLNQRQSLFQITFICLVDHILQCRTAKSSRIPCPHFSIPHCIFLLLKYSETILEVVPQIFFHLDSTTGLYRLAFPVDKHVTTDFSVHTALLVYR